MADNWQPKETAPDDGTVFIAWDDRRGHCLFTMHHDGENWTTEYELWSGSFSHWQPLPEPPEHQ